MTVTKPQAKSHSTPDEVRTPDKTRIEIVHLDAVAIGRLNLEPGWRRSECVKPVVKTDHCQVAHVGCAASGRLTVRLQDGTTQTIVAGESYTIPPGHDAWVEGNQPFVGIEVMSAAVYAWP